MRKHHECEAKSLTPEVRLRIVCSHKRKFRVESVEFSVVEKVLSIEVQ